MIGINWQKHSIRFWRIVRFALAGGLASLINLASFTLLVKIFNAHYLRASIIAFSVGVIISFSLQKFWTFKDSSRELIHRQLIVFSFVAVSGLGLNTGLVYLFVNVGSWPTILAQLGSAVIIAAINFFVYQKLVFRKRPDPELI